MKIKTLKITLFLFTLITVFISCSSDDDTGTAIVIADRTEQQVIDDAAIVNYLETHYYNSSFFETGSNHKYSDIIISELPLDVNGNHVNPDNETVLMDVVETRTVTYFETEYKYYVLSLNQGGGGAPKFTDALRVRYEGSSVNEEAGGEEEVFESSATPIELNLQSDGFTVAGTIKAWQLVLPTFKAGFVDGLVDGVVNYTDFGLGVMFIPSGLAYFSAITTGSTYDNLIFKFELLQYEVVDHDNDGIPSYIEDLDGDLDVEDDNTDEDSFSNFIDNNDDGDSVLTIDELIPTTYTVDTNMGEVEPVLAANEFERSRSVNDGVITINTVTIADSNNDDIPDYLDATIEINYNEQ
ncbi:FKBP-type peptidyl-prolyl cis-trans isomerase [Winogradskyella sp.]|uniref:FKBP-type peptidyl-prolyl cis-trans isomerase n=1 Tax=Winogradskyella sp. TaxID=1883156 RepID=UPI003AB5C6DF